MKKYLFRNTHNGFEIDYQPFELSESITQEKANKYMKEINPGAGKVGSTIYDLFEKLDKLNIKFKIYRYLYHKPEENNLRMSMGSIITDPLPECMYSWDVIECISGNY